MRRFIRWISKRYWQPELQELNEAIVANLHYARDRALLDINLGILTDLFREKQAKINRLQDNYAKITAPLREDLRTERILGNLDDHLRLIAMAPRRASIMSVRGLPGVPSNGTVVGVPFDQPNTRVDQPFNGPRSNQWPAPTISTRAGGFTAAGADPR